MTNWMRRLGYWRNRRRMEAELAEEMEFHRAMLERDGAPASAWGNTTLAREDARGVWIWPWLESVWRDAAYGVRSMARQPGFTLVALLGLGLAIGVNTSLFTLFNGIELRPWQVKDPDRVVTVQKISAEGRRDLSILEQQFFAEHARSVTGTIAMRRGEMARSGDRALRLTYTTGNYFQMLGASMALGRGFLPEEGRAGAPEAVAVLSYAIWETAFGADPRIVGKPVMLDETPFTVVGVAGRDFLGTDSLRTDVWVPLPSRKLLRPADPYYEAYVTQADFCCTPVAARLADGVTMAQAEAELRLLDQQYDEQYHLKHDGVVRLAGTAWINGIGKKSGPTVVFSLLFLAVTLILLLACANVGNLLLARAAARRREIAVRLSIGGSRLRIVRQLVVESACLAFGAAGLGMSMAYVLPPLILRRMASDFTFVATPDGRVLAYTALVAMVACLAFGLAPALHCTRGGTASALKDEAGFLGFRIRGRLLGAQVAISVMLLTGAGMLVRGLQRVQAQDPGFDVNAATLLQISLPAKQNGPARIASLARELMGELERPGEGIACGLASYEPLGNGRVSTGFRLPSDPTGMQRRIGLQEVSAGFFDALRIPVVAGRNFTPQDSGRNAILVNESAARRYWPGESAVGKTLVSNGESREVVGVVKDAYLAELSAIEPMMFWAIKGEFGTPKVLARDRSGAGIARIVAAIHRVEPRAEVQARPLSENLTRQLEPSRNAAAIAGGMGLLALALATIGMSGVFAFVVRQRTREIGVRMALGARPRDVVRLVLGSNVRVLVVGSAIGAVGAAAVSIGLGAVLPGVRVADPAAYLGVVLLLAGAAAVASFAPARRATRVDPVRALRWE